MTPVRRLRHAAATALSPRYRRWHRVLRSLTLDPDQLPRPIDPPGPRDFIICGSPRSGTSLLAAMLFSPPESVTVMEPWDALRLPPAELFASLRTEMTQTGHLARGRLDVPALLQDGAVEWTHDGETAHPVTISDDTAVGVKFPAFWRYLPLLPMTKFLVCLRDPAQVIHSYERKGGALGQGYEYDAAFNRRMNSELAAAADDAALRRILLYDYINERILDHLDRPNVFAVRYERWFENPENLVAEIASFLDIRLRRPLPGAGKPQIRSPRHSQVSDLERECIRRHCRTAATLGYPL
jgi:hypothetical protein